MVKILSRITLCTGCLNDYERPSAATNNITAENS